VEGGYRWLDAETIRYEPFQVYKVASHDDDAFFVKVFAPEPPPAPAPAPDARAIAAGYHADTNESRRFTLAETGEGLPRAGQWRQSFALGDLDGDGHLDLAHGPRRKSGNLPVIFRGDGAGGFSRWAGARYPALPYDYGAVAIADFNRDGKNDLALAAHLRGLTVLTGDGHGDFAPFAEGLTMRAGGPPGGDARVSSRALAVVDWNADTAPELVALADGPARFAPAAVRYGRGMHVLTRVDGHWTPIPGDTDDPVFGDTIAVGDLDGDGAPEVVTSTNVMGFTRLVRRRTPAGWESRELPALRPAAFVHAVATGDFDRDGRADVALGYLNAEGGVWRTGIDVVYSRGDGSVRRAVAFEESRRIVRALATGDLDGDGALDLVAVRDDGSLETFAGDGAGFLTRDTTLPAPAWRQGCFGSHVVIADLDGDGAGEILASFAGERVGLDLSPDHPCTSGGGVQAWKVRGS
jgi:hypothetical protein